MGGDKSTPRLLLSDIANLAHSQLQGV